MTSEGASVAAYRPATFWLLFVTSGCIVGGLAFAVLPTIWIFNDPQWSSLQIAILALGFAVFIFSLWGAPKFSRYRIEIHPGFIRHKGAFTSRELRIEDIEGYRIIHQTTPAGLIIFPNKPSGKKLRMELVYERKTELLAWLSAHLVNLDERDRKQEIESSLADEHLGTTREERLQKIAKARKWTRTLNLLAYIAIFWGIFYPRPYGFALGLLLALPPFSLLLLTLSRGAIRYDAPRGSSLPTIALPFMMPPFALMMRAAVDWNFVDWQALIAPASILGIAMTVSLWMSAVEIRRKIALFLLGTLFCFLYAYGATVFLNCFLDRAEPSAYESKVVHRYISNGKQTTYHLKLAPFMDSPAERTVQVPADIYNSHPIGSPATIYVRPGRLGTAWFVIR